MTHFQVCHLGGHEEPAKLNMISQLVNMGGEFLVSVAISKQTGQVYMLNGGRVNGVNCFKQDPQLGLVQMDNTQCSLNLNHMTPATGPQGTVSHAIFNENGSQLLASVKETPPTPEFIASWDVDARSGMLWTTYVPPPAQMGASSNHTHVSSKASDWQCPTQ